MADREVTIKLGIDFPSTPTQKALAGIGEEAARQSKRVNELKAAFDSLSDVDKASGKGMQLKVYQGIEASLLRQRETILSINTSLNPDLLRERVKLSIEETKARQALEKAVKTELEKQQPRSFLSRAFAPHPGIGQAFMSGAEEGGLKGGTSAAFSALAPAALSAAAGLIALKSVALASPGAMERFTIAVEDVGGVVGRTLTPVLEIVTQAVRLFGDFLASILPSGEEMRTALAPIGAMLKDLREALAPIAAVIKDVLSEALKGFGILLRAVMIPIRAIIQLFTALTGGTEKLASSVGAAARNISFTSLEAYSASVNQAAFRGGIGEGGMEEKVGGILGVLNDIAGWVKSIADKIGAAGKVVGTATDIVKAPFKALTNPLSLFEDIMGVGKKLAFKATGGEKGLEEALARDIKKSGGFSKEFEAKALELLEKIADKAGIAPDERKDWVRDRLEGGRRKATQGTE